MRKTYEDYDTFCYLGKCNFPFIVKVKLATVVEGDQKVWFVWLFGFYGISTFVGYLTPNPFL